MPAAPLAVGLLAASSLALHFDGLALAGAMALAGYTALSGPARSDVSTRCIRCSARSPSR
jgi:hypothetical protein